MTAIAPSENGEAAARFRLVRELLTRPVAIGSLVIIAAFLLASVFAGVLAPHNPDSIDVLNRFSAPTSRHLLGTDYLGRDLLSRLLFGGRTAFLIAIPAAAAGFVPGVLIGAVGGYVGGAVDRVANVIVDTILSFPAVVLAIVVLTLISPSYQSMILIIAIAFVPGYARLARAQTLASQGDPVHQGRAFARRLGAAHHPQTRPPEYRAALLPDSHGDGHTRRRRGQVGTFVSRYRAPASHGGLGNHAEQRLHVRADFRLEPGLAAPRAGHDHGRLHLPGRDASRSHRPQDRRPAHPFANAAPGVVATLTVLAIDRLSVIYEANRERYRALRDVSAVIAPGEILGVVGESGCGKSTLALALLGLLPPNGWVESGSVSLGGRVITSLSPNDLRRVHGSEIAMIFQDPLTSMNPTFRVATQMVQVQQAHDLSGQSQASCSAPRSRRSRMSGSRCAASVRAPARVLGWPAPAHLSRGRSTSPPAVLVADEPLALDVTLRAQILELLRQLREQHGTTIVFISHDLGVVRQLSDRVLVMYAGRVVEEGPAKDVLSNPRHPYTQVLLQSIPSRAHRSTRLPVIPGEVPSLSALPVGCAFAPRCAIARDVCVQQEPELLDGVRCHARNPQFAAAWGASEGRPACTAGFSSPPLFRKQAGHPPTGRWSPLKRCRRPSGADGASGTMRDRSSGPSTGSTSRSNAGRSSASSASRDPGSRPSERRFSVWWLRRAGWSGSTVWISLI